MGLSLDFNLGSGAANDTAYDVIIIGGGPAGSSAAIYTARGDLRTLVIDKGLTAGALGITSKISNYPGVPGTMTGAELVEIMREQAQSFGADYLTDKVIGLDLSADPKLVFAGTNTFSAKVIILATGSMGRTSVVKGEEELLGRGVSYCATCDGAFFRDQDVAVVGNNDEALEEAFFLTKFARKVTLVVPTPELKARPELVAELDEHENITMMPATSLKEVVGNGKVEGVVIKPRGGEAVELPVSGAFIYLQGGKPITDYVMEQLPTTGDGCLVVDENLMTAVPGVFAVGDLLCTHVKQAVVAAADGVIAAIAADRFVHGRDKIRVDWN